MDAPDMTRCQINFKRLSLTDIKIDIKRVPKKSILIKAMEEAGNAELLPTPVCCTSCSLLLFLDGMPVFLLQM